MRLGRDQQIVPVMTFHSVGMRCGQWACAHLSERAEVFERLLQRLSRRGYRTVSLQALYSHMTGDQICPPKSVVLVFDDGYLDNWVTVAPLLKKYGMQGAVYVNPDFVDPGTKLRPTIDDADPSGSSSGSLEQKGFMNWPELRALDKSGLLDVQSHSLSHTWYFVGPGVVDCYSPQSARKFPWMSWNAMPERKPYYLSEDQTDFVPWGTPVLEHEKSIVARRFLPEVDAMSDVAEMVEKQGDIGFFGAPDWQDRYREILSDVTGGGPFPGVFETEEQCEERVRRELAESKAIIERELDKVVDFLCWPGGGVNEAAKRMARDVGYKSWTLPGGDSSSKRNVPNSDPSEIKRVPAMRDVHFFGRVWGRGTDILMYLDLMSHQESRFFDTLRKAYKLAVALAIAGHK